MKRIVKKVAYWALYVVYLLVFLATVNYFFFYRPLVKQLSSTWAATSTRPSDPSQAELDRVEHVDPALMKRLGKVKNQKESSFIRHAKARDDAQIRICAFGDSLTEGDEVGEAYDYPTRLGKQFVSHGARNVEVLNFGVSGFGFHQSYMMWESMAESFNCDVHLFGPRGFQSRRDTTFRYPGWSPFFIHARYVLDNHDVRLVEVPGATYGERFDQFFRFIPRWRYLRYHRSAPIFLQALIPKNRDFPNLFYYSHLSEEEEAYETYRILLGKMAAVGKPVFVGHHHQKIVDLVQSLETRPLTASRLHEEVDFPYIAPQNHASPIGNDLLARQFFNILLGRRHEPLPVLKTVDLDWIAGPGPRRTMSSYSAVRIELAGTPVGRFVGVKSPTKADALVSVQGPEESLLDSAIFPFELELQPGIEATLRLEGSTGNVDLRLGVVQVVGGGLNLGKVEVEGLEFLGYKELQRMKERGESVGNRRNGLFFRGNSEVSAEQLAGADSITVLIDHQPALSGRKGRLGTTPGVWFSPVHGGFRQVRGTAQGLPDLDALGPSGVFELVAEHWQDGEVRVQVAAWKKTTVTVPSPAPDRPAPDRPAPDRPAPDRPAPDRPAPDRPAAILSLDSTGIVTVQPDA